MSKIGMKKVLATLTAGSLLLGGGCLGGGMGDLVARSLLSLAVDAGNPIITQITNIVAGLNPIT